MTTMMQSKYIFMTLGLIIIASFLIPSWHNAYEEGRYDGYIQGSSDAMEYTKDQIVNYDVDPNALSIDSYDYFKKEMKWRFYDQMWEVNPPEPDIWDFISYIQAVIVIIAIGIAAFFAKRSCIDSDMGADDNHER